MSDVVRCGVSGCSVRFRRAGKHAFCPGHSECYLGGRYDPFHAPCYPCMQWLRGFVNPLLSPSTRLECVHAMRDWFRRILKRNSDKQIKITAVEDPVLLGVLKGKKFVIPPAIDMETRLRAIKCALDDEFPILESPKSIPPTPASSTPAPKFHKSFAAVVSTPAGVAGPSSAPLLPLVLPRVQSLTILSLLRIGRTVLVTL